MWDRTYWRDFVGPGIARDSVRAATWSLWAERRTAADEIPTSVLVLGSGGPLQAAGDRSLVEHVPYHPEVTFPYRPPSPGPSPPPSPGPGGPPDGPGGILREV